MMDAGAAKMSCRCNAVCLVGHTVEAGSGRDLRKGVKGLVLVYGNEQCEGFRTREGGRTGAGGGCQSVL